MDVDQVVLLGRTMLQEVVILAGPILAMAIVVSLAVNVVQVLTSLQDMTISTVARLAATGSAPVPADAVDVAASGQSHSVDVLRLSGVPQMIEIPLMTIITGAADHRRAPDRAHAVCAVLRQRSDSRAHQGGSGAGADLVLYPTVGQQIGPTRWPIGRCWSSRSFWSAWEWALRPMLFSRRFS